jgi:hypothetical protein
MNLHRYAEAIPHFEATLRLKPDHPTAAAELEIARRKLAESSATRPASTAPATQP